MSRLKKVLLGIIVGISWFQVGSATSFGEETQSQLPTREEILSHYETYSAKELADSVRHNIVTSEDLVNKALEKVKEENPSLNAVIGLRETEALNEAKAIQDNGQPFLGVPILVKGLGHTVKGMPNSNGFPFAKDQLAGSNGSVVKELQGLGFIVIGQTNFPEMGWRNITDSALYGPTGSPWNPNYQAGGSSGGAASSVASGMNPVASGSDAGGSIRIPASWNGVVGLKPSRGILKANSASPKGQVVHFANTKSMEDTNLLFESLRNPKSPISDDILSKEMKIAYSTESPVGTPVSEDSKLAVKEAVDFLKQEGFQVEEVTPDIDGIKLMEGYYTIAAGSAGMAEYLGSQILKRPITIDDVDILTWALYQTGKVTTKEEVDEAWRFNQEAQEKMTAFHEAYPIYLTPTTASTAPMIGDPLITSNNLEKMKQIETVDAPSRKKLIYDQWLDALTYSPYTQLSNLTGEPAISLPTYVSKEGLPLGIQFNARTGEDRLLLEMGDLFEKNNKFKLWLNKEDQPTEPSTSSSSESETTESSASSSSESETTESSASSSSESETTESSITSSSENETTESSTTSSSESETIESSTSSSSEIAEPSASSTSESETTEPSASSTSESKTTEPSTSSSSESESKKENLILGSKKNDNDSSKPKSSNGQNVVDKVLPKTGSLDSSKLVVIGLVLIIVFVLWIRIKNKQKTEF
ncbi:LPXTG cell wall anchor domain-containing protein [Vagococcus sp. DIV0080]|uniref:LPXTG cell wall anchor domain-containing protein n=1 Tax=Candidatus Vagococcus giribetii TaxID=2230876 RepID=A0ABS3HUT6_9ENTE|nr:amidase family protein [Vagococcus sp. DIV0080]MBO0477484.1 LPXTG cell wall anchor domain-containing protein [Vagococcus sp. DIV0080]